MGKIKKIKLPDNNMEIVRLTADQRKYLEMISARAYANGEWEYALDYRMDYNDVEFGAYYLNKSCRPILKPLKGHDELVDVFAPFRESRFELNGGEGTDNVLISTAGDLMCAAELEKSKDVMYDDVAGLIFDSDISFANLESTFSDGEIKPMVVSSEEGPKINLDEPQYRTLVDYKGQKYDLVQLCNNHIIDCGMTGIENTLAHLEADGICHVGLNMDEASSHRSFIMEKAGLKVGWVSHTTLLNNRSLPEDKPWLVNFTNFDPFVAADLSGIIEQIRYLKAQGCDLIIVAMHWGLEFEFYPHPIQREWAQVFADEGADIIIGQHPHIIQYSEIIHPADDPSKDVPVVYSQGNLTPVFSNPFCCLSSVVRFSVEPGKEHARVAGMEIIPVACVRIVSEDESHIELIKLTTLISMKPEMDEELQEYTDRMAEYADMVLGTGWRQA